MADDEPPRLVVPGHRRRLAAKWRRTLALVSEAVETRIESEHLRAVMRLERPAYPPVLSVSLPGCRNQTAENV